MVKINTICRSSNDYVRETKYDITKVQRNSNPTLHQFQKAREHQRALVATKLDKMFAKPFLGCLTGHSDSISVITKCPNSLVKVISGTFDGELRAWDISERKTLFSLNAHKQSIKGVTFSRDGQRFLSSGADNIINLYDFQDQLNNPDRDPLNVFYSKHVLGNVDHCWKGDNFVTSGGVVQVWNYERSKPVQSFEWGIDTVLKVKYNPSQFNLIAGTGIDRSVVLYDTRGDTAIQKIFLSNKCQTICWNPTEPINLITGCDDGNCYSFDMRKMEQAKMIHKDHIGAVMDLDIAPTGRKFVTGSYDKTIRIFDVEKGRSEEIYHTKRMQQIFSVCWSMDNQFILSGSDDMNIRIWKAKASQQLGVVDKRLQNSLNYREALKEKFKYNQDINKVQRKQHLPKYIQNAKRRKQEQKQAKHRKIENMELNNVQQLSAPKPERFKKVERVEITNN
ncbi:hypothetical protein ABPG74_002576 [Tetrahymena malaccensis]